MAEQSTGDWVLDATNEIVAETAAQMKSGGVHLTRHAMQVDRIIREHSKLVGDFNDEKLRRVVEAVHVSLCEEVESIRMSSDAFDHWCYSATDDRVKLDGRPMPVLAVVLYRVCGSDPKRFDEALLALRAAFEAGASAARGHET